MKDKLTLKQKLFCEYYLESSGNATEAVIKAGYNVSRKNGVPDRILAKSIASENLTKPYIIKYLNSLLEAGGLNDAMVSVQLFFMITQDADLSAKLKAIDIYNKLKGRYNHPKTSSGYQTETMEEDVARLRKILPLPDH